ncbi:unnamed protein product [Knipowitschia caucasica]
MAYEPRAPVLWPLLVPLLCLAPGPALCVASPRGKGPRRSCLPLPEELLQQMYGRLTVGVLSAYNHALELESPAQEQNLSCPSSAAWASGASEAQLPLNLLSISPWAYRMSHDPGRFPRSLPEAYCLCGGCLIGAYGQESADFRSVPVLAPAVVLRRTGHCLGGRYTYAEHYISVAVGCTCVPSMEPEEGPEPGPGEPHGNAID